VNFLCGALATYAAALWRCLRLLAASRWLRPHLPAAHAALQRLRGRVAGFTVAAGDISVACLSMTTYLPPASFVQTRADTARHHNNLDLRHRHTLPLRATGFAAATAHAYTRAAWAPRRPRRLDVTPQTAASYLVSLMRQRQVTCRQSPSLWRDRCIERERCGGRAHSWRHLCLSSAIMFISTAGPSSCHTCYTAHAG